MSELVYLFPGQGSQAPEMADAVARLRPDLFELAREVVGEDPFAAVDRGTQFAQPAIYCAALAGLEDLGGAADLYAGHSLGEITALAAAGAIAHEDGLRVVAERGRLMERVAAREEGGMLAMRVGRPEADRIAGEYGLTVANDNAPAQVVLSGPLEGIEAARAEAREQGVLAKRLPVAGAFHCTLMSDAVEPFLRVLEAVEMRPPRAPVFSCVTATPFGNDPRASLAAALVRPVRWLEVMRALHAAGGRRFVETGPGKVLSGLVRRTFEGVEVAAPGRREAAHA